jgi:HlyD family secretion protein
MNARVIKVAVVVLAVSGGAALWWLLRDGAAAEPGIAASGTVEATEADLGFQIPGRIEAIMAREGDRVEAGAILARLDQAEAGARRDQAAAAAEAARARLLEMERGARRQEVARAELSVRAAREALDDRLRDRERTRRLHEGGAVSREALDKATTAALLAETALEQALEALELVREGPRAEQLSAQQALLRQAEAGLALAEAALSGGVITAPFTGTVALRHREPGEAVGAGAPVLTLRDLDDRWVRIYVRGDAIGGVHPGQDAILTSDAPGGATYRGEVFFIGSQAEFTPRNVQTTEERTRLVYPVRVRVLDDPDVELKPGLPVDVVLRGGAGS